MENVGEAPDKFDNIEHEIVKEMKEQTGATDGSATDRIIKACAFAARRAVEKYDQTSL